MRTPASMLRHTRYFGYGRALRSTLVLLVCALASPALAQDRPPQGIGFAQAEEGTWLCRHEKAEEALSCAREQCAEQAPGQECWSTAWCFPANWSGVMTIWLPDFHTTQVLCGAPSENSLSAALAALCLGQDTATTCDLTLVIDPDGNERSDVGQSFPGPAAPAEPAAEDSKRTGEQDSSETTAP